MKNYLVAVLALILVIPMVLVAGCKTSKPATSDVSSTKFIFITQPGDATAGMAFVKQPVVNVVDANGQIITAYNGTVAIGITPGSGASGATLSGGTVVNAVSGIAYFSGLSIDIPGSGYSLSVLNTDVNPAISNTFDVAANVSTNNDLAIVQNIFVSLESDNYYIYVVIKPTAIAVPNVVYTVTLYQNGQYRAAQTISWSDSIIGTAVSTMPFPLTPAEFQQYEPLNNLSSVFSAKITQ